MKTAHTKTVSVIFLLLMTACTSKSGLENTNKMKIKAPIAEKIPYEIKIHGESRVDNYYWMRLSDEQKSAEKKDKQTP